MEIWVQYTLDLMDADKPEGTLTLGGWGTEELCYKFVSEKKFNNAGWSHGQILSASPPEQTFPGKIQAAIWKVKKCQGGKKAVDLLFSDDFTFVYRVSESGLGDYNHKIGDWEKIGPITLGLVIFIKIIPIHLPQTFKTFLHELTAKSPVVT